MGALELGRWKKIILVGISLIFLLILVGPFLIPVPALENTHPPREVAYPSSQFVEVNGVDIHYRQFGQGSPVIVLLHGFGASTFSWREVMQPLSEVGTVLAFDRPAFGLTERPLEWEGRNPYSPHSQVEMMVGLLRELDVDQGVVLVGNSAGGTIAMQTALDHPDLIRGLVLVDAAVYSGGGSPAWVRPLLHTPQMNRVGVLLARSIADRGEDFLRSAYHDPSRVTDDVLQGYRRSLRVDDWDRALWELTKASYPLNLDQKTAQVEVPTLVITGDDDRIVPTEDSVRLAQDIPGAQLAVLADCGHLPQEECPGAFLKVLIPFVEQLPRTYFPGLVSHSHKERSVVGRQ